LQGLTAKGSPKAKLGMSILGDGKAHGFIYNRDQVKKLVEWLILNGIVPGDRPPQLTRDGVMRLGEKRHANLIDLLES
jgi:hypothetical protein